jgi:hypothetical protein
MTEKLLGRGIYVDTDRLRRTAAKDKDLAQQLRGDRKRFSAGGQLSNDAFGLLPPAASALSQYRTAHHNALANVDRLIEVLEQTSSNLDISADNYDGADQS